MGELYSHFNSGTSTSSGVLLKAGTCTFTSTLSLWTYNCLILSCWISFLVFSWKTTLSSGAHCFCPSPKSRKWNIERIKMWLSPLLLYIMCNKSIDLESHSLCFRQSRAEGKLQLHMIQTKFLVLRVFSTLQYNTKVEFLLIIWCLKVNAVWQCRKLGSKWISLSYWPTHTSSSNLKLLSNGLHQQFGNSAEWNRTSHLCPAAWLMQTRNRTWWMYNVRVEVKGRETWKKGQKHFYLNNLISWLHVVWVSTKWHTLNQEEELNLWFSPENIL